MKHEGSAVTALQHPTLALRVYEAIRELIEGGTFPLGGKVVAEEVGRRLGVSRTPVWEAFKRLAAEGLVRIIPRQGCYIVSFTVAEVQQLYVVRELLEGFAARLAAEAVDQDTLGQLARCLERQEQSLAAGDLDTYFKTDLHFHNLVVEGSRNQTLAEILANLYRRLWLVRRHTLRLTARAQARPEDHRRMYQALAARDADRAEDVTRAHVRHAFLDALEVLQGDPGLLDPPVPAGGARHSTGRAG
ncbi:MAG: GntR family transcriptional regulator [Deltaproteobacteria bacterium]|nr:GntR family transcriptional regulator [Deltaproteobacteria bacterium]